MSARPIPVALSRSKGAKLTLAECRDLLGPEAFGMSDEEVLELAELCDTLAGLVLDDYGSGRRSSRGRP